MNTFLGLTGENWLDLGFSVLIVLVAIFFGGRLLYSLLRRITERTPTTFDDEFIVAIKSQIHWFVIAVAFQISTFRLTFLSEAWHNLLNTVYFLLYLGVFFAVTWRLIDFVNAWYLKRIVPEAENESIKRLLPMVRRIVRISVIIITATILLAYFGVEIVTLMAALGLAGLALSLAAQDTLSDVISGFVIMMDAPYRVGDRIEIQSENTWGDVVEIGLRTTRIRIPDNRMVIVPNSVIGKSQVINYTYPDPQYRIETEIRLEYGSEIEGIRPLIVQAVRQVEGVLPDKPVEVLFLHFGDSSLIVRVRWWIESYTDARQAIDLVNSAIYGAFDEAGIEIPYPKQDIHHFLDSENADRISQAFKGDQQDPTVNGR